jgi:cellulose synthase (UDP-forming)
MGRLPARGRWPAVPSPRAWITLLAIVPCILALLLYGVAPFPLQAHSVLAAAIVGVALFVSRRMTYWRLVVPFLSVAVSLRYTWWRGWWTLASDRPQDTIFSVLLFSAELYGFAILICGYFQTAVLQPRRPRALAQDLARLPNVDVFIPTYNEPEEIVRRTLVGALGMDYPKKTVYLLDDGQRPRMGQLAAELGARYFTRADNKGAKAGNINAALRRTRGELVAIFDADHVPVRSFLGLTVGFFVADPRLALVQTPHHFYNPDPFERNLWLEDVVPPEQEMFYQAVQVGNDFWNSAFFCGSCAVLRREALLEVGGVAQETVTEDAHTALRMHAAGWRSAYLDVPQAAGLATERYAFHVAQRIRWARGMVQIFRLDNPLFKPGLTLAQRFNYLNSIQHFLFGWPRLIYLTAPAVYLLFDVHPVNANAWEVVAYAAPHIAMSMIGGVVVARSVRHGFWAEVFETALAPYVALVTTLALIAPKRGKFNVTTKGAQSDRTTFDWRHAMPTLVLLAAAVAAASVVPTRWVESELDRGTLAVAAFWNGWNLVILVAASMVALERPQRRAHWRLRRDYAVHLVPAGEPRHPGWAGRSADLSEGGAKLRIKTTEALPLEVDLTVESEFAWVTGLRARVLQLAEDPETGEVVARLSFLAPTPEQHRSVLELMFCAPDSWQARRVDESHPVQNLGLVLVSPWRALARAFGLVRGYEV